MHRRRPQTRLAFTLVELLVVVGIIALLISILFPAMRKVRESARRAVCLSNAAQLTKAALLYMGDNRQTLPDACNTNSADSPLSPRSVGLPPGALIAPETYVLPTAAHLLSKYLGGKADIWRCPSAPEGSFVMTGTDPLAGTAPDDEFKPNYSFMATKDFVFTMNGLAYEDVHKFRLKSWTVRNVAGLRLTHVRPTRATSASSIVLFYDKTPNYHAPRGDIYSGAKGHYWASYGYLDGHADGRDYENVGQYLNVFHHPIPQRWFGADFATKFATEY